jgi:ABC-type sugar transport system ATPase subunit
MNGIELRNVTLLAGDFQVSDVTFAVPAGEYFILMGHTGSGKSLLMKAICGVRPIQSGSIFIGGRDVTRLQPRARRIGYVPQDSGLFPHLDVRANLGFALDLIGRGEKEWKVVVDSMAEELGIVSLLGRRVGGLSGGERQKVAIARALTREPRVLLLDEPVSAVDEATRDDICNLLERVHREHNLTTIHICHNRVEADRLGDRVGVMSNGVFASKGKENGVL